MTNRKLKKKIRQAFEHATPDLADKIAVDSLFSDISPQKKAEPPIKPLKTSIQFRAIATLAASIAVVALLVGLLPKANPLGSSKDPDGTNGQSQAATGPTDKIQIDPDFSYSSETDDFDWTPYYKHFNPTDGGKKVFHQQAVQVGGKSCYLLAADYQLSGEYVIVDPETNEVLERKTLIGSTRADEPLAFKYGYIAISYVITDWQFALVDGALCYEYSIEFYKGIISARINAVTGEVLYDHLDPAEPINTEGPPAVGTEPDHADFDPLYVALEHAGLTKDDISNYEEHLDSDDAIPHWDVTLYTTDYAYTYEIEYCFGEVLQAEKQYVGELTGTESADLLIDANEAVKIANADPMIGTNASVNTTALKTEDGISFYRIHFADQIYWCHAEVSSSLGIVLKIRIASRNYYYSVDDDQYISTIYPSQGTQPDVDIDDAFDSITPPDGKIGNDNAIDAALRYAGLTIDDIGTTYCDEVTVTDEMAAHYDVAFYYDNYKWHYRIGMYSGNLLDIEKIPISE